MGADGTGLSVQDITDMGYYRVLGGAYEGAELLVARGDNDEALALLERIPESDRTRPIAAAARLGDTLEQTPDDDYDDQLTALLPRVKADDEARQQFVDILELMGPADPRTADYRRRLTATLF